MTKLTLDQVNFDDKVHLRWWYEIRNSDAVRRGCRTMKKITVDEHYVWWQESKVSKTRKLYFIRTAPEKTQPQVVGIARLDYRSDPLGDWTEFSLAVVQEWRGQGFAKIAITHLINKVRQLKWPLPGAVVGGQNPASLVAFIKSGFLVKKHGFILFTLKGKR